MTVIIATLVGFITGRMLWLALRTSWRREVFIRKNFNGVSLPTAAGIVLPLALLLVEAGRAVAGGFGIGDDPIVSAPRAAALVAIIGFAMLGLLDDLAGRTDIRGFAGHVRALASGRLTSGGVKLLGGGLLSLVAAGFLVGDDGGVAILVAAAVIALSANLINLFDLRPGRATKVSVLVFAVLALAVVFDVALVPVAVTIGAAAALLIDDLHEKLMLGDTGANALGAAIGIGLVTQLGTSGRIGALVVLFGLNLASEFVSFTKVIDSVGPLRALDRMGRRSQTTDQAKMGKGTPQGDELRIDVREGASSTRVNVGGAPDAGSPREPESSDRDRLANPSIANDDAPRW